ncbi:MAG: 5-amino-6-(D-ribitylamino)uracil--L-tyrosine 4-hydroxyphenyl transferase CofH [Candidatus Hodarchaeaceae archaeon]|nr:5-amino-6-(D-ribitylamino)uracil--L-tyrosine 4-hydroxyphenyl transferase CofH [Candidatus Hodarchaeaceae archaeon]
MGSILDKALCNKDIDVKEATELFGVEGQELWLLAVTADELRHRAVGGIVTYVINRNINHSNICVGSCKFCAFRRSLGDPDAYVLTREQIAAKVREAVRFGATEVCVQGGLHPDFGLEDYLVILRAIRGVSRSIHIHAFSPAELDHISRQEGLSIEEVIKTLREAGLNSVPGTAAEILVDRVRGIICPKKLSSERWIGIIKACHRLGLPTTATMLYGHVETPRERAKHMEILREIQRETHGFTEFVPLSFMPHNTPLQRGGVVTDVSTGADDIRVHAVARLMLTGYIDNVQASWVKLGPKLAQVMLGAGANDLSGTLMEENISRAAGAQQQSMLPRQLERLILDMGRVPRQRTTTYGTPPRRSAYASIA